MTVKSVMDTWTLQTGFPLLTVQRNYDDQSATLSQERFLLTANQTNIDTWWIPVTYTHPG